MIVVCCVYDSALIDIKHISAAGGGGDCVMSVSGTPNNGGGGSGAGSPTVAVQLERLAGAVSRPQDNLDMLRATVQRLHTKIKQQDAVVRLGVLSQLVVPGSLAVQHLVKIMEVCHDPLLVGSICTLFHDSFSPSNKGEVRNHLIQLALGLNMAEVIFRTLKSFAVDGLANLEVCTLPAYQVLAKLCSKDSKISIKARLVGGVRLSHDLLKANTKNNSTLLPILMVIKYLTKNSSNQVLLGKEGCVCTMATLLNSIPKTHWAKLKFIMEVLAHITKAKSNVVRLIREPGFQRILATLDIWEKIERRHQVKLVKALLVTISHVCDSKHGRKAVINQGGVEVIQRFIQTCPADKKFDNLLASATNVFLKCCSKGELPVSSLKGAIKFQMNYKDLPDSTALNSERTREVTPGLEMDSSDEDADDELEEDDDDIDWKNIDITDEYSAQSAQVEELLKLECLFPELSEREVPQSTKFMEAVQSARRGSSTESAQETRQEKYLRASDSTKSLLQFIKVSYPDLVGAQGPTYLEPLYDKDRKVCRNKAMSTVERLLHPENYMERVVYDLDYLIEADESKKLITPSSTPTRLLSNWDEKTVGKRDAAVSHLNFESRFESGNLRRAIQVSKKEYDLILNADVNSSHHHQWFYFEVSNMEANTPYIFNIINNEKPNSEFNFGMKPVMFSVMEAMHGRPAWVRIGTDICYHKNHYCRTPKSKENFKARKLANRCYYTATFTITFQHAYDVCYLAYHYPYTYTQLQTFLSKIERSVLPSDVLYSNQLLCQTLNGNLVPLLTITSKDSSKEKEVILLTSRVHPGESNASWVMQGTICHLLTDTQTAKALRKAYIFKIVPMLNPEGVIHGNQRCGLTDEDLNRRWRAPNVALHPTIYHTKNLLSYLTQVAGKKVRVFCDFHGHSRQKNVFMYGCSRMLSWWPEDKDVSDNPDFMLLPRLASKLMTTFSLSDCHFQIERGREATARVAVWRQFGIPMSYTMEASTCGCDQGVYKNCHLSPRLLLESGDGFCIALSHLLSPAQTLLSQLSIGSERSDAEFIKSSSKGKSSKHIKDTVYYIADGDAILDSEDELDFDLYGCF